MLIFLVILLVLMSLLGTTADYFLVPQLQQLSKRLKLSPTVAGLTLLALGNTAPDVFTNISAVMSNQMEMVLGELLGATVLLTSLCLGCVLLAAPRPLGIRKWEFVRDICMLLVVETAMILATWDGVIQVWEAALILGLYIGYICLAVYMGRKHHSTVRISFVESEEPLLVKISGEEDPEEVAGVPGLTPEDSDDKAHLLVNAVGVAQFYLEYPFSVLRWLSIPGGDTEWDQHRRRLLCLSPTFSLVLAITCGGFIDSSIHGVPVVAIAPMLGVPLSALLVYSTNDDTKPSFMPIVDAFGFLCSVAWLYLIAGECVTLLQSMGLILGLSTSILALTVLAIGNSIGDLVSDTAVAKTSPAAGVSACFGAPLSSTLLGLGISFAIVCGSRYPVAYEFHVGWDEVLIPWVFIGGILTMHLVVFSAYKFSPPREYGYVLILTYIVFMATSITNHYI